MSDFVRGHRLSAALYEHLAPVLSRELPTLRYAAALIGRGSDVLGFDSPTSMDHDWGPRLQIVLAARDADRGEEVYMAVERNLPPSILGVPIDQHGGATRPGGEPHARNTAGRPRAHGVTVTTVKDLFLDLLGQASVPHDAASWLRLPSQALLEFTAGPVHRDDEGELTAARDALAWYPTDVWRYVMADVWQRIAQAEPLVGRTGEVGDHLGSRTIAAAIACHAMHLALLQRRIYPAYAKWVGSQLARGTRWCSA